MKVTFNIKAPAGVTLTTLTYAELDSFNIYESQGKYLDLEQIERDEQQSCYITRKLIKTEEDYVIPTGRNANTISFDNLTTPGWYYLISEDTTGYYAQGIFGIWSDGQTFDLNFSEAPDYSIQVIPQTTSVRLGDDIALDVIVDGLIRPESEIVVVNVQQPPTLNLSKDCPLDDEGHGTVTFNTLEGFSEGSYSINADLKP